MELFSEAASWHRNAISAERSNSERPTLKNAYIDKTFFICDLDCQIFLGTTNQNGKTYMYQNGTLKIPPTCREIHHNFPTQGLPKCTKI
jgi:hypothetical protein